MKKYVLLPDEIIAYLNDSFEELELASYNGGNAPKDKPCPFCCPCLKICFRLRVAV